MSRVHFSHCPVCGSSNIDPLLNVKDHSVSGEEFVIWQCGQCTLRFTQDVPDEQSIGPYYRSPEYISHSNTQKGLVNRLYQKVRKRTLEQKAKFIMSRIGPKGKILDVGAGVGAFLNVMRQKGWDISGVEPDPGARQKALELFQLHLSDSAALHEFPSQTFDAITMWHVLEHVHALHEYVQLLKSLIVDNGKIFIAVPNYKSLDEGIYRLHWAAYDVPRHLYHFSPKSMEVLLKNHGLQIVETKRMWYDSFYISMLSSKYKRGKTNWLAAVVNGLRSDIHAAVFKNKCSSLIYVVEKSNGTR